MSTDPAPPADTGITGRERAIEAFTAQAPELVVRTDQLTAHDVSVVVVSHNGSRWLPRTLEALSSQSHTPDRIIAVDTGSTDESPRLLADALGSPAVTRADARTSYGAAVEQGVLAADSAKTATTVAGFHRTEWIWLLHDDSAPAPDALQRLLECAVRRSDAGVIGPKVLDWQSGQQLLEVGISITGGGRRHTGLDRREYDQGQHDETHRVLSVGSAGMLVRRDVWDELNGFDPAIAMFRDDVDFGWRANQAGYSVIVCPEAVMYHAEAAAHGRRRLGATKHRPHLADRRNSLYVVLANSGRLWLPLLLLRVFVVSLGRSLMFLLGKQPGLAGDEIAATFSVIGRPDLLIRARAQRRKVRKRAPARLKPFFPRAGQQIRHTAENILGVVTGTRFGAGHDVPAAGRRVAIREDDDEPDDDDAFILRILTHPAVLVTIGLSFVTLIAIRSLIGTGHLFGGALAPAPDTVGALWSTYTEAWHGIGLGSSSSAPPYIVVVALMGSLLGNASVAVDFIFLLSVPLAGLSMYALIRRLATSKVLRIWGSVTFALMLAMTGAISSGHLGTIVAAVLTPIAVLALARAFNAPRGAGSYRYAVGAGLILALLVSCVPMIWLIALAAGAAFVARRGDKAALGRLGIVLVIPPVVLMPWTFEVLTHPSLILTEVGVLSQGFTDAAVSSWSLLLQQPTGPGSAPVWLGIGVLLVGWVALFRSRHQPIIRLAWVVVAVALALGIIQIGTPITTSTASTPVSGWPGYLTILIAGALVVAGVCGADGAKTYLSTLHMSWRQPVAIVLTVLAVATPVVGAAWWMFRGADDPLTRSDPRVLPAYVADEGESESRVRTLVLREGDDGSIGYQLLRHSGWRLGEAESAPELEKYQPLTDVVADVVSGRGAADSRRLADFAVKYVYLPRPFDRDLADTLDTVPGLARASAPEGAAMWEVQRSVSRLWLTDDPEGSADITPVPSSEVGAKVAIPEGKDGRVLVLSELADSGWKASIDGRELTGTTYGGWAQAFKVDAAGGQLALSYEGNHRSAWLWVQLGVVLALIVLSLPGIRRERGAVDDVAEIDSDDSPAPTVGKRARHRRSERGAR